MNATTPATESAEKALALVDYQTITTLAHAAEKVAREKKSVEEASPRLLAACAEDLAKAARELDTILQMGDVTGVSQRHPKAWAAAAQADLAEAADLIRPTMAAAYGR